ncbi:hypothetical protein AAZX31_03G184700 [Glycine max]|uniref:Cell division cycle 20.1, cofactor of APC complex isoform C n=1 Tax=Glycine soja TaxID=3848 RepID=A0A445LER0_GLYSO|nr:Cell division cycle 20.1, cofactor of APC complex isoform C [Glycine soja]
MEDSMRLGFMAVVAVSGSMAFLVHQVHKRSEKHQAKKKVRFAKEALRNNSCRKGDKMIKIRLQRIKAEEIWVMKNVQKWRHGPKEDMMPPNRAVLYKGIMKYRKRSI